MWCRDEEIAQGRKVTVERKGLGWEPAGQNGRGARPRLCGDRWERMFTWGWPNSRNRYLRPPVWPSGWSPVRSKTQSPHRRLWCRLAGQGGGRHWPPTLSGMWDSRMVSPEPGPQRLHFPGWMLLSLFIQAHLGIQASVGSMEWLWDCGGEWFWSCFGRFNPAF